MIRRARTAELWRRRHWHECTRTVSTVEMHENPVQSRYRTDRFWWLIPHVLSNRRISAAALLMGSMLLACCTPNHFLPVQSSPHPATFYLDCSAQQSGNGTRDSPWTSVKTVSTFTFRPGDHLLLKRGASCMGTLTPQGSGIAGSPIVIDAYGNGAQPVIDGGSSEEALKLLNQQYWEINNLEIKGGNRYGVYVSGNVPSSSLNHIYLRDLNVHGAAYTSTKRADSGEVFIATNAARQILNDVVIDSVTAHDSHVSEGIFVSAGGTWIEANGVSQPLGSNVIVQNSTAHDIYGDGILISELNNGLLQRNVVYRSGLCPDCTGSTPVGLWEWYCHTCTVQYNESYGNQSWGGDGGDFDIDYYDNDNIVQYNYGHDSAGYCVAFFGAGGKASINNIFRYNICSNNGRKSELSKQGEIFLHTWDGGSLDGVQIYNNTFYWNPALNAAALTANDVEYSGINPRFFKNNAIYATTASMVDIQPPFILDNNIYWTTASPTWKVGSATYSSLSAYQAATKQDIHSYYVDPMLAQPSYHAVGKPTDAFRLLPGSPAIGVGADVCSAIIGCSMGSSDFWGYSLHTGRGFNIGAYQGP
jgi:hypothetical protein